MDDQLNFDLRIGTKIYQFTPIPITTNSCVVKKILQGRILVYLTKNHRQTTGKQQPYKRHCPPPSYSGVWLALISAHTGDLSAA